MSGQQQDAAEAGPQEFFAAAVALHQQGRLHEAEAGYVRVLQVLPGHPKILGNLAALYQQLGRLEEAAACCREALAETPDDPLLHLNLGAIHEEEGDPAAAEACYRRTLELEPDDARALNNLGKVLQQQGRGAEGERCLRRALELLPDYPLALNNLGVVCGGQGRHDEALACFRRALELEPESINALYNIAGVYNCLNRRDEAIAHLRRLLALQPDHAPAGHMLAALSGETTEAAPREYVEETFDAYAGRFDRHLTEQLQYTVPQALQEIVASVVGEGGRIERMLDLGCGTGLAGEAFRPMVRQLHGIDISAGMLARAGAKNLYDLLEQEDLAVWLEHCRQRYDLIIATDVFVYIGQLDPIFAALDRCTAPGALLGFSIERCDEGQNYLLRPSGRYAQSPAYIERLAAEHGWTILTHRSHGIRREEGEWIAGDLYLLRR